MIQRQLLERLKASGLDTEKGVARLDGDVSLYLQVVRRFTLDDVKMMPRLRKLLETGSISEARVLAHKLRGSAAIIGAAVLSHSFHNLENELISLQENGGTPSPRGLEKSENLLDEMADRLGTLDLSVPEDENSSASISLSKEEWIEQLSVLRDYIDLQQPRDSLDLIGLLISSGPDGELLAVLKELESSVHNYCFDRALELVATLLKEKRIP